MSIKYFCSSDIHSFFKAWMDALVENGFEVENINHHIVICGDLFDRGPDARECLSFAKEMAKQGRLHYVRGNHEDLLCDCYHDLMFGRSSISHHHISNGTIDTVRQFMNHLHMYDILNGIYERADLRKNVSEDVLDFIQEHCVDYFEVADHIFVHGWLPCVHNNDPIYYELDEYNNIYPNWRDDIDTPERDEYWEQSRWINGMLAWAQGMRLPGKTIVCGHFHSSWGHAHIHGVSPEWGPTANFNMFKDNGIIALDGCTAYTGKVNVYTLEV